MEFLTKWMVGAIHNVFNESQFVNESTIVFRGNQGCGKTTICRYMMPKELRDYYAEVTLDKATNDTMYRLSTNMIVMLDELGGMVKKDPESYKKISSTNKITQRRPYAPDDETFQRICSLLGTTNEDEILHDPTGNRRIIILDVEGSDHEQIPKHDTRLMWLEAYHLFKTGYHWNMNTPSVRANIDKINEYYKEVSQESQIFNEFMQMGKNWENPDETFASHQYLNQTQIFNILQEKSPFSKLDFKKLNI